MWLCVCVCVCFCLLTGPVLNRDMEATVMIQVIYRDELLTNKSFCFCVSVCLFMCVCVCLFECVCVSFLCFKTPHLSLSLPFSMLFPLHLNCLSNFLSLEGLCVSVFSKQRPCLTDEVLGGIDPLNWIRAHSSASHMTDPFVFPPAPLSPYSLYYIATVP